MKNRFFKSNAGLALPVIMIIVAIVFLFCTITLILGSNLTNNVMRNTTREDALHIAEAGINKYLFMLNNNSDFYKDKNGSPDSGFVPSELYTAADDASWVGYPKKYSPTEYKSGSVILGCFQIEVKPPTAKEIVVTITSTGWIPEKPDIKRIIEVKIYKRGFTNYVIFSGEMKGSDGGKVYWGTGEHIKGPFFTNGTLRTIGTPIFHDRAYYCIDYKNSEGTPSFLLDINYSPEKSKPLVFPSSNSELEEWALNGGYTYIGRTSILLNEGFLNIRNKTNKDNLEVIPLPSSGVIYVDGDVFISGKLDGRLTVCSSQNIYICGKDPTNFVPASATITGGITYSNTNIPDSLGEHVSNMSDDMLGLIANNKIQINTVTWPSSSGSTTSSYKNIAVRNIKIMAAILGIKSNSTFGVENIDVLPDMGYVYFTGSRATHLMDATMSQGDGYLEDNTFDYRMIYESPPHFLEPENSGWEIKGWKEK